VIEAEAIEEFNKEVEWLKKVVAPEDIYIFANQALLGAHYFLNQWSDWVDIRKECEKDKYTHGWVHNLCGIHKLRALGITEKLSTKWKDE
jgi:hypothetical protein